MTRTLPLLAALLALAPGLASAQTTILRVDGALTLGSPYAQPVAAAVEAPPSPYAAAEPEHAAPRWRLDFGTPGLGLGGFFAPAASYERSIATLSFDVRIVGAHGHGAMVRYVYGTNVWGEGSGLEADYVFRARLVGDDRVGLGFDAMGGLTVGALDHDDETIPAGTVAGANVSLQLDLRLWGFVISGGVQYRFLLPTETARNGGPIGPEHALTGTVGLGFGFWGS